MKIPIRYNHVGYSPLASKIFFVNLRELSLDSGDEDAVFFRIVRSVIGSKFSSVWEGPLVKGTFNESGYCDYTGETLWSGDFSNVHDIGIFMIQIWKKSSVDGETLLFESAPFEISADWMQRQLVENIRSFYFQRSGVELVPEFAGKWARPAAHLDDCIEFHPSMQRSGISSY